MLLCYAMTSDTPAKSSPATGLTPLVCSWIWRMRLAADSIRFSTIGTSCVAWEGRRALAGRQWVGGEGTGGVGGGGVFGGGWWWVVWRWGGWRWREWRWRVCRWGGRQPCPRTSHESSCLASRARISIEPQGGRATRRASHKAGRRGGAGTTSGHGGAIEGGGGWGWVGGCGGLGGCGCATLGTHRPKA